MRSIINYHASLLPQIALHMRRYAVLMPQDDQHVGIAGDGFDILQYCAGALSGWTQQSIQVPGGQGGILDGRYYRSHCTYY